MSSSTLAPPSGLTLVARRIALWGLSIAVLLPLLWLVLSSFRAPSEMFFHAGRFAWGLVVPEQLTFENYTSLFKTTNYGRALFNSLFVAVTAMFCGVILNAAAGFAFAVFEFPGRNWLFAFVLAAAMMPFEGIVIPLYLLVDAMGMIDTYPALIVPDLANGFVIFMFRQFFAALPRELYEAARVDGASWGTIFWRVAMPLSFPVVLTGSVMIFLHQFEAFFWPLVAAPSAERTVVQVAIAQTMSMEGTAWGHLFSSMTIASLVALVPFLIFQKYYIRSNVMTGIK
ncbi:carbohydrate ABC transporter permease [Microvirga antarctica]|uniref:carbohydrate ABC transporter permease n=1 Tax=Microvirga antarctica TaxID=2819233 RepID=UPI001B303C14|nr:carbohydrate ABC transporter permease [Microvirga antarctica]